LTPLAGGAAEIRHFVLFWDFFPIFGEFRPDFDGFGQQIDGIVSNGSLPAGWAKEGRAEEAEEADTGGASRSSLSIGRTGMSDFKCSEMKWRRK
jgi:hypothetical protein